MGGVPLYHTDIETIPQFPQTFHGMIYYRDVVLFAGQMFRDRHTYLTGTEDNYFHKICL